MADFPIDPDLDLVLDRTFDAPVAKVWRCWTEPDLLMQWFCPLPWRVSEAVLDLRPGGRFSTRMRGPEGEDMPNEGIVLQIIPERLLVTTDAMTEGFRPTGGGFMSATMTFAPEANGTRYRAVARHANPETRDQHEAMGFHQGWGTAADQLAALAATL